MNEKKKLLPFSFSNYLVHNISKITNETATGHEQNRKDPQKLGGRILTTDKICGERKKNGESYAPKKCEKGKKNGAEKLYASMSATYTKSAHGTSYATDKMWVKANIERKKSHVETECEIESKNGKNTHQAHNNGGKKFYD